MKNIYNILTLLFLAVVTLSSCSDDSDSTDINNLIIETAGTTIAAEAVRTQSAQQPHH